jgi:hypothetical protein
MKWTYLLFLIFSSWLYQRIVVYPPVVSYRSPASVASESCLDLMQGFYPTQSKDFLEKRITANQDFHSFYRAFVPLYYHVINSDKEIKKTFATISKYKSAMGGDVHTENFGFVINSTGSARLVLNDVDDVTTGPIYLDVLRHYISGKIVSDDVHWKNYLSAYQAGLKNSDHTFSEYVKMNKQNASVNMKKFLEEYISSDMPIKFIKFKRSMYLIDEVRKKEILDSLKLSFSKIKIFDQYLRIKEDGGSAGLLRYEVLAQLEPNEEPIWLDIKAMTASSFDKVFTASPPSYDSRMSLIKNTIYENNISSHISMIKIGQQDFSVRYMNQFGLGVSIADIPNLEVADVILDEAYSLGQMHARGLGNLATETYSNEWDNLAAEDVKNAAKKIRTELERQYSSKI